MGAIENTKKSSLRLGLGAIQQPCLALVQSTRDHDILVAVEVWCLICIIVCEVTLCALHRRSDPSISSIAKGRCIIVLDMQYDAQRRIIPYAVQTLC